MTLDTMFIYQYIDANYTTNYLARLITHVTYALIYYPTFSDRAICWLVREERIRTLVTRIFLVISIRPHLKRKKSLERTLRLYTRMRRLLSHL